MRGGVDSILGIPVLGTDDEIARYDRDEIELVNGIGSVGVATLRRKVYEKFKAQGYIFRQVVHPSAVVSPRASLGEGVQVMAGAVINIGASIGENSIVNTRASIDHDCAIGSHVHIAPGCTLSGNVAVGDGCHIGTGASVIQGVSIGQNALVGAGSVAIRDVAAGSVVCGVPARTAYGMSII